MDLRNDKTALGELQEQGGDPISVEQGRKLAAEIKAHKYMECSALTQDGVKDIFDEGVRAVLAKQKAKNKKKCIIM